MTSEAVLNDIFTDVIEVVEHRMPISHSPCQRRSIGPLPSCYTACSRMENYGLGMPHLHSTEYRADGVDGPPEMERS